MSINPTERKKGTERVKKVVEKQTFSALLFLHQTFTL
jgi:hypothetical protein